MKQTIFLLCTVVCAASCTHVYYAPNTANVPLLSQKGETLINGLYSEGSLSTFSGGEFQVATAVSSHVGIMANTMFVSTTKADRTTRNREKALMPSLRQGYLGAMTKRKNSLARYMRVQALVE